MISLTLFSDFREMSNRAKFCTRNLDGLHNFANNFNRCEPYGQARLTAVRGATTDEPISLGLHVTNMNNAFQSQAGPEG